jgi:tyrosine-protein phosphatase SIW14
MVASWLRYTLAGVLVVLLVGGPIAYWQYKKPQVRNLRLVREGVLYRSGQLTLDGLKQAIRDYAIKTVVTLRTAREPGEPHPALDEEEYCRNQELNYYRLQMKGWVKENGHAPVDESVRQFLDIMKNPDNYPVMVHCFAGKHRTGAYCAIYRMEFEHWTNDDAIEEMLANGYDLLDEHTDVQSYLREYRPAYQK